MFYNTETVKELRWQKRQTYSKGRTANNKLNLENYLIAKFHSNTRQQYIPKNWKSVFRKRLGVTWTDGHVGSLLLHCITNAA